MSRWALLIAVLIIPAAAIASELVPPPNVVRDNPDLFVWFLGLLLAAFSFSITIIGYFLHRGQQRSDANNTKQWDRIDNHEERIGHLEGEHRAYHHSRIGDQAAVSHRRLGDPP